MTHKDRLAEHLADAYEAVARANHYMVGVLGRDDFMPDEYDAAEQILIARQNALDTFKNSHGVIRPNRTWRTLERALDILAYDRKRHAALFRTA